MLTVDTVWDNQDDQVWSDALYNELTNQVDSYKEAIIHILEKNNITCDSQYLYVLRYKFESTKKRQKATFISFKDNEIKEFMFHDDVLQDCNTSLITKKVGTYVEVKQDEYFIASVRYTSRIPEDKPDYLPLLCETIKVIDDSDLQYILDCTNKVNYQDRIKDMFSMMDRYKQVIFTGAPGTGKTYNIRELASHSKGYEFIQFHPSYDYTDFIEGLRPVSNKDGNISFALIDGTFKAFCRRVGTYNLEVIQDYLKNKYSRDISSYKDVLDVYKDSGIKEEIKDLINQDKYYFIIDEINRADISRVFGEVMFGIEGTYRGVENAFKTQYSNLDTYGIDDDIFERGFFVPENVYIVGSMNNIDRSVESMDFALRRRFKWQEIKANDMMLPLLTTFFNNKHDDSLDSSMIEDIVSRTIILNDCISKHGKMFGLNESYHIGPSYLKDYNFKDNLLDIWNHEIRPILLEYVLGRNQDDIDDFIVKCKDAFINKKMV